MYIPFKGGTVLGDIGGGCKHLIIICNDPVYYDEEIPSYYAVLTVNVTSWKENNCFNDDTCILLPGSHPFIKHKSFVYYQQSIPWRVDPIIKKVENKELIPMETIPDVVLNNVLDVFEKSIHTPRKSLRFYKRFIKANQ